MTKRFCDCCGKEITEPLPSIRGEVPNGYMNRWSGEAQIGGKRLMFNVTTGVDGVWNAGDVCLDCIALTIDSAYKVAPLRQRDVQVWINRELVAVGTVGGIVTGRTLREWHPALFPSDHDIYVEGGGDNRHDLFVNEDTEVSISSGMRLLTVPRVINGA